MHPLLINTQNQKRLQAGMDQISYKIDYQSLSSESISLIERQADTTKVEPIGEKTAIMDKPKRWEPNLILNSDQDPSDSSAPEFPEGHQALMDQGYVLDTNGFYTKNVSKDTAPLAAYGYYLKQDLVAMNPSDKPVEVTSAYNIDGCYIGDAKTAKFLCEEKGILPQLANNDHKVCSIGKSRLDGKWYGWSHRAITGFEPGSKVEKGDCAYIPDTLDSAVESLQEWHRSPSETANPKNVVDVKPVAETPEEFSIRVYQKGYHDLSVDNPSPDPVYEYERIEKVPRGRGEWIAASEDDARQMACDFAASVSSSVGNAFESISAKTKNPLDYAWYRYTDTRRKMFKKHHKSMDLEINTGDRVGIRAGRGGTVYLVEADSLQYEFKLSDREATLLLKKCKPFAGKVEAIRVIKGNMKLDQMKGAPKRVASHTQGRKDAPKRDTTIEKPMVAKKPRAAKLAYFGFVKLSAYRDAYTFVGGESVKAVKSQLDTLIERNKKNIDSGAAIFKTPASRANGLRAKMNKKTTGILAGPVYTSFCKSMKPVVENYLPPGVAVYDETVAVPSFKQDSPERKTAVFYGNQDNVLRELYDFVVIDKYFSGIFNSKDNKVSDYTRVTTDAKGNPYVLFVTSVVSRSYLKEAKDFIKRIQNEYGKAVQGDVQMLGRDRLTVRIFLVLKRTSAAQQFRSIEINTIIENAKKKSLSESSIKHHLVEIRTLRHLADNFSQAKTEKTLIEVKKELKEAEDKLNKLSEESIRLKTIAYNIPMYSIKIGQTYQPVEVKGLDPVKGDIEVLMVRGRQADKTRRVTNLWSFRGKQKLL